MGEIERIEDSKEIIIHSRMIIYGDSASNEVAQGIEDEINTMWNEPKAEILFNENLYKVRFEIQAVFDRYLSDVDILSNVSPRLNFIRVEDFSPLNISWVDGIGSNTGYFLLSNLYKGSTTVAHEYGHSIGLAHPSELNFIGKGRPGIMYPRGMLVSPEFQYDPNAKPGEVGGTLHPMNRRVTQEDIDNLQIPKHLLEGKKYLGNFTSVYHPKHIENPKQEV